MTSPRSVGGGLQEKIDIELRRLAANVLDPNTKAEAARKLTITLTIKPNKQRNVGDSDIDVRSTLAPSMGIPASFVFDFDKEGRAVMKELKNHDRDQLRIENGGQVTDGIGNVVPMGKASGQSGPFR